MTMHAEYSPGEPPRREEEIPEAAKNLKGNIDYLQNCYKESIKEKRGLRKLFCKKLAILEISGWIDSTINESLLGLLPKSERLYLSRQLTSFSRLDYYSIRMKMTLALKVSDALKIHEHIEDHIKKPLTKNLEKFAILRHPITHSYTQESSYSEPIEPEKIWIDHHPLIKDISKIAERISTTREKAK